jgi:hypothetical protein
MKKPKKQTILRVNNMVILLIGAAIMGLSIIIMVSAVSWYERRNEK